MHAEIAGAMLAIPIGGPFLAALWRSPSGTRRRQLAWGLVGAGLIALTYLPFLAYKLDHNFAETRATIAYFSYPGAVPRFPPQVRVLLAGVRILAWPLTGWPLIGGQLSAFPLAAIVAGPVVIWRELAGRRQPAGRGEPAQDPATGGPQPAWENARRTNDRLLPLFAAKGGDACEHPLLRDGTTFVSPDEATTAVLLCDTYWLTGCGGAQEENWLSGQAAGRHLTLVERFWAAPERLLSVYRSSP
ncbi:MAG: hypothetical protein ABSA21_05265 [Candidatus Limnocylindrales bacterium]|jgi:hypothetical protein